MSVAICLSFLKLFDIMDINKINLASHDLALAGAVSEWLRSWTVVSPPTAVLIIIFAAQKVMQAPYS